MDNQTNNRIREECSVDYNLSPLITEVINMNTKLQIYKENGKVIISKKSKFLGVVELENEKEIRKVASYLYKLIIKEDEKN